LEQQQAGEFISNCKSDSSVVAEISMDRYECEFYDQFANQEESMITDDCIGNYVFLIDPYSYDFNTILSSSFEHFSEEKVIMIDNQDLMSREQEGEQCSSIGTIMAEQEFSVD
jgi:hypothetical protein